MKKDLLSFFNKNMEEEQQQHWFYKLDQLFNSNHSSFNEIFIASDIPGNIKNAKRYTKFDSFVHFYDFMINKTPPEKRYFYEIINPFVRQKIFFDIDIKVEDLISEKKSISEIMSKIELLSDLVLNYISVEGIKAVIYSSHSKNKVSFHIIIDGVYFENILQTKIFVVNIIREKLVKILGENDILIKNIDYSVYKKTQLFRILHCQKISKIGIVKKMEKEIFWNTCGELKKNNKISKNILDIATSLVSFTLYSKPIPIKSKIFQEININYSPNILSSSIINNYSVSENVKDEDEKNVKMIMDNFEKKNGNENFPFDIRDISKKSNGSILISLQRNRESYCKGCERVHENENPYIVLNGKIAYFHCRRSSNGKPVDFIALSSPDDDSERLGTVYKIFPIIDFFFT